MKTWKQFFRTVEGRYDSRKFRENRLFWLAGFHCSTFSRGKSLLPFCMNARVWWIIVQQCQVSYRSVINNINTILVIWFSIRMSDNISKMPYSKIECLYTVTAQGHKNNRAMVVTFNLQHGDGKRQDNKGSHLNSYYQWQMPMALHQTM